MPTIYVLLCSNQKYYIGKTDATLQDRIISHFRGIGSEWTRKYAPIKVVEEIRDADEFDEDKVTKRYMKTFGIQNVRGGSYTQLKLPRYLLLALQQELCTASELCFRCNRPGHFVSDCYASTKADGSLINVDSDSDGDGEGEGEGEGDGDGEPKTSFGTKLFSAFVSIMDNFLKEPEKCYRCEREGHFVDKCYAKTNIHGKIL